MPLYEYRCSKCGEKFEVIQKFADAPLTVHEGCGGTVERLISLSGFSLKGTGWYATDYARGGSSQKKDSDTKKDSARIRLSPRPIPSPRSPSRPNPSRPNPSLPKPRPNPSPPAALPKTTRKSGLPCATFRRCRCWSSCTGLQPVRRAISVRPLACSSAYAHVVLNEKCDPFRNHS